MRDEREGEGRNDEGGVMEEIEEECGERSRRKKGSTSGTGGVATHGKIDKGKEEEERSMKIG